MRLSGLGKNSYRDSELFVTSIGIVSSGTMRREDCLAGVISVSVAGRDSGNEEVGGSGTETDAWAEGGSAAGDACLTGTSVSL